MRADDLQGKKYYTVPKGYYMTFRRPLKLDEKFVIHWRASFDMLWAKLEKVDASILSCVLYDCLASDLEWPYGNVVQYNMVSIAARLGVSKAGIYTAFKGLTDADVVRKVKKGVMLLDPYLVWAGSVEQHGPACERWDTNVNDLYPDYFSGDGRVLDMPRVQYGQAASQRTGVREAASKGCVSAHLHEYY